ncbi:hypothetical protein QWY85_14945 [Neolewinella lacunae]|uniref:Uncharacterized protein n=1 Tax=Neolewinella lacunae TaxID=1517758 RepID=A0A923PHI7_9BACT|nr:hypothetical protein [Neolewinella lacunae]MBC6992720.1 hypothetical protein [Neolewinella lacunae]MDN3635964.1 hypothetical protein [Neolewinella lacunae]
MSTTVSDLSADQLKEVVLTIFREHPELIKHAVMEILEQNPASATEDAAARRERMRALIQEDFDQYDSTFKALA